MLSRLYYTFEKASHSLFSWMLCQKSYKHYAKLYKSNGITLQRLTRKEKEKIRKKWNVKIFSRGGYSTWQLYKSVTGKFVPELCSEQIFRIKLEPQLIDKRIRDAWDDKNLFEKVLPGFPFPEAVARNIHGAWYDKQYNLIDRNSVCALVRENLPVIIKPSIESGRSRGVQKIETSDQVERIISDYKENFIIQKLIKPCPELKKVSINSVPILRMITFFIADEPVFGSATLRTNTCSEAVADNYITKDGGGMLVIGVGEDGCLKGTGIYSGGKTISCMPNGVPFEGMQIPQFDKLKDVVLKAHRQMPMYQSIGWDVTVDENYNPIIMEYNLKGMGIYYYQLANGPLFGQYTDEMIKKYL